MMVTLWIYPCRLLYRQKVFTADRTFPPQPRLLPDFTWLLVIGHLCSYLLKYIANIWTHPSVTPGQHQCWQSTMFFIGLKSMWASHQASLSLHEFLIEVAHEVATTVYMKHRQEGWDLWGKSKSLFESFSERVSELTHPELPIYSFEL